MPYSDADLVACVVRLDDRDAFAELVRRHQSPVRQLLRRLTGGDTSLADDLAQETFVRVYRKLGSWRGDAKFSSWLYRVTYNVFASDHAKRARRATDAVADVPDREPRPAQDGALRTDLETAMMRLPAAERAALVLVCVHGLTHEEAASVLGCPVGTVKTHVHRGKMSLREMLDAA